MADDIDRQAEMAFALNDENPVAFEIGKGGRRGEGLDHGENSTADGDAATCHMHRSA
ncbi:hypothetical protein [Bosea sp. TAF32]|uniref:hypothetical protein n=1 Tax=Bosea sp. TAF32 TaxID=3237482 RepID=UPI003F8DD30E